MAVWTAPTTRSTGALVSASIWNTDIVENLKYLKDSPVFDGDISVGDDLFLTSTGAVINFASGDVTITHSTNTLTFAGATSGYTFSDGNVRINTAGNNARLEVAAASGEIFRADASGGAFRIVADQAGVNLNGVIDLASVFRVTSGHAAIAATSRLYLDGVAATGDTYLVEGAANNVSLLVGGNTKMQALGTTVSVSTSATTILANAGGVGAFCIINGSDGSNRFCDLVLASTATAPTVVASYTSLGSPAARTYTRSSDALQLAMASGTYTINSMKLGS